MAKAFEDSDVWLSDGVPEDEGGGDGKVGRKDCFPIEFPFEFAANLESPVEYVTETEASDEDGEDYVAGLTRQMARYFLQDEDEDEDEAVAADASEAMAGSPQSTLCAPSSSSNKRSSNGPSLVSSPIEQRGKGKDPGVLLHEAAGQVMRLRINELGHRESILDRGNPNKTSPAPTSPKKAAASYFSPNPAFTPQQLQAAHACHFLRRQSIKQQHSAAWAKQSKAKSGGGAYGENTRYCRPLDLPASAWPPLRKSPPAPAQQQKPPPSSLPGRGMRAVFLHAAGAKKESAGTGVFLPRTVGKKLDLKKKRDLKKKTGCSSAILVPDRVVQALNLNLEDFAAQPRFPGGFVLSHDVLIGRSNAHRKPHHTPPLATPVPPQEAAAAAVPESQLPREWTY